jgi:hypothetical protein
MEAFAQENGGGGMQGQGMGDGPMGPGGGPMGPGMDPSTSIAVTLGFSLLLVYPFWRIYRRAGLNPWFSLLVFLPYVGLPAAAVILAFQRWPTGESRRAQGGVFAPKPARGPKSSSDEGS